MGRDSDDGDDSGGVRLDKWLWAARFYKTRSLASAAIEVGKVKVRGERVKPARAVRIGDTLLLARGDDVAEVVVRQLSSARGPAAVAQLLYDETEASRARRARARERARLEREPAAGLRGRPSKRDARVLRRLRSE
jgi:ribosome-associated heat shock protein Hsp15